MGMQKEENVVEFKNTFGTSSAQTCNEMVEHHCQPSPEKQNTIANPND
jgi:hypothetical protein